MNLSKDTEVSVAFANDYIKRNPGSAISVHFYTLLLALRTTRLLGLLLVKYMRHIKKQKGSAFLHLDPDVFSSPEMEVLQSANKQIDGRA